MDLRHLRNFVTIARLENFSRAADVLHVAQPTLSQQTAAIEAELGVQLFERRGRGVVLTPAGHAYLEGAERTLEEADRAERFAQAAAEGRRGMLRIGFVPGAMMNVLPPIFRAFRRANPDVDVVPHALPPLEQVERLQARRLDLGILRAPRIDPTITARPFWREPLVAVLPDDHPLSRAPRALTTADLAGEPLVLFARSADPWLAMEILRVCAVHDYRPTRIIEAAEEETVIGLVAAGFGVALAPEAWRAIRTPGVSVHELATDAVIELSICWTEKTEFVDRFVDAALSTAGRSIDSLAAMEL